MLYDSIYIKHKTGKLIPAIKSQKSATLVNSDREGAGAL